VRQKCLIFCFTTFKKDCIFGFIRITKLKSTIKESIENKKLIWIAFACSLVFLFIAFKCFISELPDENNIAKITGILKDDIKKENRGRGKKSLIVKLKNYPEIDFMIGSVSLDKTYSEKLTSENKTGDSITIFIIRWFVRFNFNSFIKILQRQF